MMKTKTAKDSIRVKLNKVSRMIKANGFMRETEILKEMNIAYPTWYQWRKLLLAWHPNIFYDKKHGTLHVRDASLAVVL